MRTTATLLTVLLLAACSSGSDDDAGDAPGDTTAERVDDMAATDADPDAEEPGDEDDDAADDAADEDDVADDTTPTTDGDADGVATTTSAPAAAASPTTTASGTDDDTDDPGEPSAPTTTAAGGPAPPPTTTAAPPTTTTPPPPAGLDAAAARRAFDAVVTELTAADGFLDLPECPLDPTGELVSATFAGNGEAAVLAAVDSPPEIGIFDIGGGFGPMLTCDRFSEDDADSLGLFSFRPPGTGLQAYAQWFANPDGDDGITITVEQTDTLEGGTVHRICGLDEFSDDFDFCEIDWVTDDIIIGVYVSGPVANTADLVALENGFTDHLEAIVSAFTSS